MFQGISPITIDEKGRISLPVRLREQLVGLSGSEIVVTKDQEDACLVIYPKPAWHKIVSRISELPSNNYHTKRLTRNIIGFATELEISASGRILLPQKLREKAGLGKHAVLMGQLTKIEIWDEALYEQSQDDVSAEVSIIEKPQGLDDIPL